MTTRKFSNVVSGFRRHRCRSSLSSPSSLQLQHLQRPFVGVDQVTSRKPSNSTPIAWILLVWASGLSLVTWSSILGYSTLFKDCKALLASFIFLVKKRKGACLNYFFISVANNKFSFYQWEITCILKPFVNRGGRVVVTHVENFYI